MTKLLVLSDSHGARDAIERILNKEQNNVDAVIFLGDGLRDLEQALAFFPHLRVYSVAGNCDYGALELTNEGFGPSAAAKAAAQGTAYSKSEVYKQLLLLQQEV